MNPEVRNVLFVLSGAVGGLALGDYYRSRVSARRPPSLSVLSAAKGRDEEFFRKKDSVEGGRGFRFVSGCGGIRDGQVYGREVALMDCNRRRHLSSSAENVGRFHLLKDYHACSSSLRSVLKVGEAGGWLLGEQRDTLLLERNELSCMSLFDCLRWFEGVDIDAEKAHDGREDNCSAVELGKTVVMSAFRDANINSDYNSNSNDSDSNGVPREERLTRGGKIVHVTIGKGCAADRSRDGNRAESQDEETLRQGEFVEEFFNINGIDPIKMCVVNFCKRRAAVIPRLAHPREVIAASPAEGKDGESLGRRSLTKRRTRGGRRGLDKILQEPQREGNNLDRNFDRNSNDNGESDVTIAKSKAATNGVNTNKLLRTIDSIGYVLRSGFLGLFSVMGGGVDAVGRGARVGGEKIAYLSLRGWKGVRALFERIWEWGGEASGKVGSGLRGGKSKLVNKLMEVRGGGEGGEKVTIFVDTDEGIIFQFFVSALQGTDYRAAMLKPGVTDAKTIIVCHQEEVSTINSVLQLKKGKRCKQQPADEQTKEGDVNILALLNTRGGGEMLGRLLGEDVGGVDVVSIEDVHEELFKQIREHLQ